MIDFQNEASILHWCLYHALLGDWDAVREQGGKGLAVSPNSLVLHAYCALAEYQTGDFGNGIHHLDLLASGVKETKSFNPWIGPSFLSWTVPVINAITGTDQYVEDVRSSCETMLSAAMDTPMMSSAAGIGLALLAAQQKDKVLAEEQYAYLNSIDMNLPWLGTTSVSRILGLLAKLMGNLDQSTGHFEDALAFCRKAGYHPELAWSLCDYADMLLESNGEGDHDKAVELLDESLSISTELGMRPLMERVLSRRDILKA